MSGLTRRREALYDRLADRHESDKAKAKARAARERLVAVGASDPRKAERQRWAAWLASGAHLARNQVLKWNLAGRCEQPVTVLRTVRNPAGTQSMLSELEVRCRKCPRCLAAKSAHWSLRARHEMSMCAIRGFRTWFGTLTLTPQEHFLVRSRCRARAAKSGEDFDRLPEKQVFAGLAREGGALVTRWLKRVRKQSQEVLRYMLVVEAHKSGLPHFHILIHEVSGEVRKAVLRNQWQHGFSKWNLVRSGPGVAKYVCKYIAKSPLARVRASGAYGKAVLGHRIDKTQSVLHRPTQHATPGAEGPGAFQAPPVRSSVLGDCSGGTCVPATGGTPSGSRSGAAGLSEAARGSKSAASGAG